MRSWREVLRNRRLRASINSFQSNCPASGHLSAQFFRMSTLQSPVPPAAPPRPGEAVNQVGLIAETGLVPSLQAVSGDAIGPSSPVARLPVELDVAVPVREFRVRDLLALQPNMVIETQWGHADDVPLAAGDVRLAWSEFEVVETQLAVRVTRLA
jgi:hypothetical protein